MSTVCGTGSGNFPQPGDPNLNDSILTTSPAFGGIDVKWTYPGMNPHAVAHTLLYRSTNPDPATRVLHRTVTGDYFYDKTTTNTLVPYYYWIQMVSVNETVGDLIGPATSTARPTIDQVIEMLSGMITEGQLAGELKTELSRIDSLNTDLTAETAARLADYDALTIAYNDMQLEVDGSRTLIATETQERQTADSAQANAIDILGAKTDDNTVLLTSEQQARATADEALGTRIDTIQAADVSTYYQDTAPDPAIVTLSENDLWVDTTEPTDGSDPEYSVFQWITDAWVPVVGNTLAGAFAAVEAEQRARVTKDGQIAQSVETLETSLGRKSRVFFTVNVPVAENTGDWWVDTDDSNTVRLWVGDAWVIHPDYTGSVFRQPEPPIATAVDDLWFDSNDSDKPRRWDGETWVPLNLYTGNQVTSAIQSNNRSMIGYCLVNGSIDTSQETPEACDIAGGSWLPATPLAESVKAVQINDGEDVATVEQKMTAYRDNLEGLNVQWSAQVDVNGVVGGFGIFNDGTTIEAGFDVDRFWVGRSNTTDGTVAGSKPFIIENGEVYIKEAIIKSLTFDKLRSADGSLLFTPAEYDELGNVVQDGRLRADYIDTGKLDVRSAARFYGDVSSNDFVAGSTGWLIRQDGYAELNEATIRGNLEVNTITVNGEPPYTGLSGNVGAFTWGLRDETTTGTSASLNKTDSRSDTVYASEVPENGVLNYSLNRSGSVELYYDGRARSGGNDYDHAFSYTLRFRARLYVDGVLVKTQDKYVSGTTVAGAQGYVSASYADAISFSYTYPAYKATSTIQITVDTQLTASTASVNQSAGSFGTSAAYIDGSIDVSNQQLTGEISRLG